MFASQLLFPIPQVVQLFAMDSRPITVNFATEETDDTVGLILRVPTLDPSEGTDWLLNIVRRA